MTGKICVIASDVGVIPYGSHRCSGAMSVLKNALHPPVSDYTAFRKK